MQGTVATFDPSTRSGRLLTDDGTPLDYDAPSLADHIRHLRVGQRVFIVQDPTATITQVSIFPPR